MHRLGGLFKRAPNVHRVLSKMPSLLVDVYGAVRFHFHNEDSSLGNDDYEIGFACHITDMSSQIQTVKYDPPVRIGIITQSAEQFLFSGWCSLWAYGWK